MVSGPKKKSGKTTNLVVFEYLGNVNNIQTCMPLTITGDLI